MLAEVIDAGAGEWVDLWGGGAELVAREDAAGCGACAVEGLDWDAVEAVEFCAELGGVGFLVD